MEEAERFDLYKIIKLLHLKHKKDRGLIFSAINQQLWGNNWQIPINREHLEENQNREFGIYLTYGIFVSVFVKYLYKNWYRQISYRICTHTIHYFFTWLFCTLIQCRLLSIFSMVMAFVANLGRVFI